MVRFKLKNVLKLLLASYKSPQLRTVRKTSEIWKQRLSKNSTYVISLKSFYCSVTEASAVNRKMSLSSYIKQK